MSSLRTSVTWAISLVSKLNERAAFNHIHGSLIGNSLYPVAQSAYKRNHNTETALLRVMNDILLNMNKQHVTIIVSLDLSAAFDTVDHSILLNRLSSKLGLNGTALASLRSYLSGRSPRVSLREAVSDKFDLRYGVPQGLAHFSLQSMQAHCLMSWRSNSQMSIIMPMTLSHTSRLVPKCTLARLIQLLLSNIDLT